MSIKADLVIENANIFTSDANKPRAEALAIKGNRIVFVGANEDVEQYKDTSTRVIDGMGHTITPGFIDSHFHLLWGSISMGGAQLYEVKGFDDLQAANGWKDAELSTTLFLVVTNWTRSFQTGPCILMHMMVTLHGQIQRHWKWQAFYNLVWMRPAMA